MMKGRRRRRGTLRGNFPHPPLRGTFSRREKDLMPTVALRACVLKRCVPHA